MPRAPFATGFTRYLIRDIAVLLAPFSFAGLRAFC